MKKIMLLVAMMLMTVQGMLAKTVKEMMEEYSKAPNAELTNVTPQMMSMIRITIKDEETKALFNNVDGIKVLSLEGSPKETKKKFLADIDEVQDKDYQPLVMVNGDGEKVQVLVQAEADNIKEVVVFATDKEDCSMIVIKGNLNKKDLQMLVDEQTKKK